MSRYQPLAAILIAFLVRHRDRLATSYRNKDRGGMSVEAMIIIAGLALIAITVMGIVSAKIIAKANDMPF